MENKYWTKKALSTVCASSHDTMHCSMHKFTDTFYERCYKINYECTANYPAEFLLIKTLQFN